MADGQNIIVNITWNRTLWHGKSNDKSGFGYIAEGGWPNESFNFDFDLERNTGGWVYGFFMTHNPPTSFREGGVVVFASRRHPERGCMYIVGVYGRTTLSRDYAFVDSTNLRAERAYSTFFDRWEAFPLDDKAVFLDGKKRIGRSNFNYISDEATRRILDRGIELHADHPVVLEKLVCLRKRLDGGS
jgi:hypothetical protein